VVTSVLVFEGEGRVVEYTGGYEDWIRQRDAKPVHFREILAEPKPEVKSAPAVRPEKSPKFLKREQRELEELPAQIEKMEADVSVLNEKMWDPELYKKEPGKLPVLKAELAVLEERIRHGYARWEQLEEKRKASDAVEA
jgi:ATP-binding cassette subfamily F protein uup